MISLAWTAHATYDGVSLELIRSRIIGLPFEDRAAAISHDFHSQGWVLVTSLVLGTLLVLMASMLSFSETMAAFALARVGAGSRRQFTLRLARSHPPRQGTAWVVAIALSLVGFLLCSGSRCTGLTRHTARSSHHPARFTPR